MTARPAVRHLLLLLPLVAVVVWVAWRAGALRDDPAAVLRALRAAQAPALPEAGAVGATDRSTPETYDRESLYQFIDGAAEAYLARGFEACVAATYSFAAASHSTSGAERRTCRTSQSSSRRDGTRWRSR